MSKNITIQEGGLGKQLTADKLKTNLVGGGTCLWVPEDETVLVTKHITEDGTYRASDDGYYGYSEVSVSGIGTATGTGPDGETHSYTEDGEGGITDTVLPDSISVVTPPTVTTYADGATIDFSGMVVKAYLKSGGVWSDAAHPNGIIPINELTLPVTTADSGQVEGQTATSDLTTQPASPIKCGGSIIIETKVTWGIGPVTIRDEYSGGMCVVVQGTNDPNYLRLIIASDNSGQFTRSSTTTLDETGEIISQSSETIELNSLYTYNGKTVYYHYGIRSIAGVVKVMSPSAEHLNTQTGVTHNTVAWTIIYGTISGGTQEIPVQWSRPGDYSTLESSFNITVT